MNIPADRAQELKDWLYSDDGPYGHNRQEGMMHKADYQLIADAIRDARADLRYTVSIESAINRMAGHIANALARDNVNFSVEHFLAQCEEHDD